MTNVSYMNSSAAFGLTPLWHVWYRWALVMLVLYCSNLANWRGNNPDL